MRTMRRAGSCSPVERSVGVGVESKGGTDTRTENTDAPTTSDHSSAPPPDNPGSPGRPSRLESLARARQGQEQNGSQQTEAPGSGAQTDTRRDDRPGSPQTDNGTERVAAPGKPENGQAGPQEKDPRSHDSGSHAVGGRDHVQGKASERETDARPGPTDRPASSAQQYTLPADNPGAPGQASRLESLARARQAQEQRAAQQDVSDVNGGQAEGERDKGTGPVQSEGGGQATESADGVGPTDSGRAAPGTTRTERGAASSEEAPLSGSGTAADGSSGGERRTPQSPWEHMDGRASEARPPLEQEARPANTETAAGGGAPEAGRSPDWEHGPLPRQDATEPADGRTSPGTEQDRKGADEVGGTDEHPPRPASEIGGPQESGTDTAPGGPVPRRHDAEPAGDVEPGTQVPGGSAYDTRTTWPEAAEAPAEQPADQPQNAPAGEQPAARDQGSEQPLTDGDRPRPERDGKHPGTETSEPPGTGRDASAVRSQDETKGQGTETQDVQADSEVPVGEAGDRQTAGSTPAPSQETGEAPGTHEASGETNGDHGRKTENGRAEQSLNETNETNPEARPTPILSDVYTDGQGQVQVEPRYGRQADETNTELVRNQPETTEPTELPDRDDLDPVGAQSGEARRGELRDPENDPLDRNPGDPERPSRRKELLKEAMRESENIVDTANKAVEGAFKALDPKPPTGHPYTARDTSAHMDPIQTPVKAGSGSYALLGAAILVTQAARWSISKIREIRGRDHAGN